MPSPPKQILVVKISLIGTNSTNSPSGEITLITHSPIVAPHRGHKVFTTCAARCRPCSAQKSHWCGKSSICLSNAVLCQRTTLRFIPICQRVYCQTVGFLISPELIATHPVSCPPIQRATADQRRTISSTKSTSLSVKKIPELFSNGAAFG